ncbi:MAG: hypothetical protein EB141_06155 [Verrucomicrobia bacterium]|nr:hypothetical protein [Verrucomicrobiota bacterium]NBU11282.1 hypothetical protein [Pseudomonadota bacterium]NDA66523.1 hypothetical protein [Verrucomicrobiota bacterium]NDB75215.1 hypothetical protein [Verrucomicrobiota bacterium]NDE97058.1 hypothetical protein [Verrucomicrobiota bacterium]
MEFNRPPAAPTEATIDALDHAAFPILHFPILADHDVHRFRCPPIQHEVIVFRLGFRMAQDKRTIRH